MRRVSKSVLARVKNSPSHAGADSPEERLHKIVILSQLQAQLQRQRQHEKKMRIEMKMKERKKGSPGVGQYNLDKAQKLILEAIPMYSVPK